MWKAPAPLHQYGGRRFNDERYAAQPCQTIVINGYHRDYKEYAPCNGFCIGVHVLFVSLRISPEPPAKREAFAQERDHENRGLYFAYSRCLLLLFWSHYSEVRNWLQRT